MIMTHTSSRTEPAGTMHPLAVAGGPRQQFRSQPQLASSAVRASGFALPPGRNAPRVSESRFTLALGRARTLPAGPAWERARMTVARDGTTTIIQNGRLFHLSHTSELRRQWD